MIKLILTMGVMSQGASDIIYMADCASPPLLHLNHVDLLAEPTFLLEAYPVKWYKKRFYG
ncbi:MAG: hypothetical protein GY721_12630 [Deltaproteobacteria bacterium]|nr:hypothetical protein [Deltaproteobacteria bacterium]